MSHTYKPAYIGEEPTHSTVSNGRVNNYEPYIIVRWPHGGVIVWNWRTVSWDHHAEVYKVTSGRAR